MDNVRHRSASIYFILLIIISQNLFMWSKHTREFIIHTRYLRENNYIIQNTFRCHSCCTIFWDQNLHVDFSEGHEKTFKQFSEPFLKVQHSSNSNRFLRLPETISVVQINSAEMRKKLWKKSGYNRKILNGIKTAETSLTKNKSAEAHKEYQNPIRRFLCAASLVRYSKLCKIFHSRPKKKFTRNWFLEELFLRNLGIVFNPFSAHETFSFRETLIIGTKSCWTSRSKDFLASSAWLLRNVVTF